MTILSCQPFQPLHQWVLRITQLKVCAFVVWSKHCAGKILSFLTTADEIQVTATNVTSIVSSGRFGYKFVGDNLDFHVKARYMRTDGRQNQSLHFFHTFAILDRIDFSKFSFKFSTTPPSDNPVQIVLKLLPSPQDDKALSKNVAILVSRILATHVPFFKRAFHDVVTWHIHHEYYEEMSQKSDVVSSPMHAMQTSQPQKPKWL